MKHIILLNLLFVSVLVGCLENEDSERAAEIVAIDSLVEGMLSRFDIPGVAIAVTKDSSLFYANAYGLSNVESKKTLTVDQNFHFASVSKPFVATAIVQLAEQGKLQLTDKLTEHLPYFKMDDERYQEITIQQMLNHTSGIGDVFDYEWDKPQYDEEASERFVRSLADEKMWFGPGEDWSYSNMAYDILGDVIAKVSGKSFEEYIRTEIFVPLGMNTASFIYPEIAEARRTSPHTWKGKKILSEIYPYNRIHAPSSTLNASVLDLSKWAIWNLQHGEGGEVNLFSPSIHQKLWEPTTSFENKPVIGLSWFLGEHKETKVVWHGGGDTGYRSYVLMAPEQNISVVIASNFELSPVDELAKAILDIMLEKEVSPVQFYVGVPFVEKYQSDGLAVAKDWYQSLDADSVERQYFVMGEDGLSQIAYYADYLGLKDDAKVLFEYNLEIHPQSVDAHNGVAHIHKKMEQDSLAIHYYEQALTIDPDNETAQSNLRDFGVID